MLGKVQRSPTSKKTTPAQSASDSDSECKKNQEQEVAIVRRNNKRRRGAGGDTVNSECDCRKEIMQLMTVMMAKQDERMIKIEGYIKDLKTQSESDSQDIKSRVDSVQNSSIQIESNLALLHDQIKNFEGKIQTLDSQCKAVAKQVTQIDSKLEDMDRFSLKSTIEIRNVPKKLKESKDDLLLTLLSLMRSLNYKTEIRPSEVMCEVKDLYRLPAKQGTNLSTIVVEFANIWSKNNFLNAVRLYKKNKSDQLNAKHLGFEGQFIPIYISERLTPKAKRLHFLAREFAKTEKYDHCWVTNGKVLLRKREGAPLIVLKNEEHLHSLRQGKSE